MFFFKVYRDTICIPNAQIDNFIEKIGNNLQSCTLSEFKNINVFQGFNDFTSLFILRIEFTFICIIKIFCV